MRKSVWVMCGILGCWLWACIGCGGLPGLPDPSAADTTAKVETAAPDPVPHDFNKGTETAARNAAQWEAPLTPAFEKAAASYEVPLDLLLTLAKIGSGFENRGEAATIEGGYGLMALRKNELGGNSLELAAQLTGVSTNFLIADPAASINGAAAVLSAYAVDAGVDRAAGVEAWLPAVIKYAGLDAEDSKFFAYGVYEMLSVGIDMSNSYGETFRVAPHALAMDIESLVPSGLKRIPLEALEAGLDPDTLGVDGKESRLQVDYPGATWDPAASCNYSTYIEGKDTIVIHTAEGSAAGTRSWFKNCAAQGSSHYVVSEAGGVWQMVEERYRAWHATCLNSRSVGIEHEGYAGSASHPVSLYNASAALCRNICDRRGIVKAHRTCAPGILGHIDANNCHCGGSHWDPGGGWDWNYFIGAINGGGCNINMTGGAIRAKYESLGGCGSFLGAPTTYELTCPDGVGKYNHFQNGSIYWTPSTNAWSIRGAIRDRWSALGWETGPNGYPTTDENTCPDGVGKYNHFQNGSIYWTQATGAHSVVGAIHAKWSALGWELGPNGYPTSSESPCADGVGRYNTFQNGAIYWSPALGANSVVGAIYAKWRDMNYENGALGYPTSDEYDWNGGRRSDFEDGYIYWTPAGGAVAYVNGDVQAPSVPGVPTATAASTTQINLSWAASTDNVGVSGYKIYRNGAYLTSVAGTTYNNTGLTAGTTYVYTVSAYDAANNESAQSGQKDETTWIIVDNVDAGFTASANWSTGTSATDKYGASYRFRSTSAISDVATWTYTIPTADTYEVYVWWSQGTNRSTAAPYSVNGGGNITRNQQSGGGAWNSLGTFSMAAGANNVRLSCWAAAGYVVVGDAVRIVRR